MIASALEAIDGIEIERDAPAGPFCTYRVGGPIRVLARVETPEALGQLAETIASTEGEPIATLPIGRGSNLLVADAGFDGVGIVLGAGFADTAFPDAAENAATGRARVIAGAGAPLPLVARATVREGLSEFEWAVGVPGTIGGGVRMNAGGHGSDIAANLVSVDIVDLVTGKQETKTAEELDLGYRISNVRPHQVVTSATLDLGVRSNDDPAGEQELSEIVRWRRANQPGGQNAGSVFTNPPGDSAGRLIDVAGLKGYRVGSAEVSVVHANFIQVDPNGSANDVMELMKQIVQTVESESGLRLHAETRLVGFAQAEIDLVQGADNRKRTTHRNEECTS